MLRGRCWLSGERRERARSRGIGRGLWLRGNGSRGLAGGVAGRLGGVGWGFRDDGEAEAENLEDGDEGFEGGVALGGEGAVEVFAADTGLGGDSGEAVVGFSDGSEGEQGSAAFVGVGEGFEGSFDVFDCEFAVAAELFDLAFVVGVGSDGLFHGCLGGEGF